MTRPRDNHGTGRAWGPRGAVLEHLDILDFADRYYAVEPSRKSHNYLLKRHAIGRLVASEARTIGASGFVNDSFDLAILSHVVEHVPNPARLISEAMDIATFVVVEVPLEGTWTGNLRAAFKEIVTGFSRVNNTSGHQHFFNRRTVEELVRLCGGEILGRRSYVPIEPMKRAAQRGSLGARAYAAILLAMLACVGQSVWARTYYGHHAILFHRRPPVPKEHTTRWDQFYFAGDDSASDSYA